ncbi:hypothetical protein CTA1_3823 [Colletotrichum tanaceti]|uniref:Uncharacterized protein n=1 Tax=Colletotrichum tanaceti TaxID=1306861 RepID=A0A4U6X1D7_9PEZI|nr:hypothetical protein CTA1_3823 [Colletotrichum tanaceti]
MAVVVQHGQALAVFKARQLFFFFGRLASRSAVSAHHQGGSWHRAATSSCSVNVSVWAHQGEMNTTEPEIQVEYLWMGSLSKPRLVDVGYRQSFRGACKQPTDRQGQLVCRCSRTRPRGPNEHPSRQTRRSPSRGIEQ